MTAAPIVHDGHVYIAPTGTPPPTSPADLKRGGQWIDIGTPTEQTRPPVVDPLLTKVRNTWTLERTYQPPEPYRPNRAARRAAARTTKRGRR